MNDLDKRIQEALKQDDAAAEIATPANVADDLIDVFRGRRRWMNTLAFIYSLAAFGVAIWAGIRFEAAEAVHEQLRWGGICLLFLLVVSFIKVYIWLEMHSNRVLRELKRVELLLLQQRE